MAFFYLHTCPCYNSVIFYLQFIMLLVCTHCLYTRAPSLFLTHLLGPFLTILHLHVQIGCFISLIRRSWDRTLGVWSFFLLITSILISFTFLLFSNSLCIRSSYHSFLVFIVIMCGHLYVLLQWLRFIVVDFCSLFGFLKA